MRQKRWFTLEEYQQHLAALPRPQRRSRPARRPEQEAGAMLVQWIDLLVLPNGTRPGQLFAHIPNGGARTAVEAAILKGQGVRKGWPDYFLALPRGRFHGMFLELKAENGGKPSDDQLEFMMRLGSAGFHVAVAWGFDDARRKIEHYLSLGS